jgi:LacI family transcriptional regulator
MSEVARRAGVSTATVSRVLSGDSAMVREATREKVMAAVAELGYYPNRLARNLRERSARIFALVVSDIGNPFFTAIARGCEDAARANGYSVIFCNTDENGELESQRLLDMVAEGVAGIVLASTGKANDGLAQVLRTGIPLVALDRTISGQSLDEVTTDGRTAAREAVQRLLDVGHKRIALIGGPDDVDTMIERRRGFEEALKRHGIPLQPAMVRYGDLKEDSGRLEMERVLALETSPTALLVSSNLMAIGALKAVSKAGLAVPDDLSIICFDDVIGGELIGPGIAAVIQPTHQIGWTAVELLLRRIADREAPVRKEVLPTEFVPRGSIGALPPR